MNPEFMLQYRSMNVEHLLADEIEHELLIRQVAFKSSESVDAKKRKLRNKLKEQRETNVFAVVYLKKTDECKDELNRVDEKLAKIRDHLENRTPKKIELPAIKTRLIHLLFRLDRLKLNFDTQGLELEAMKLLDNHFTLLSVDPDTRKRTEEQIRADMSNLSIREENSESQESDTSHNENILVSRPKRKEKLFKTQKRKSSTSKSKRKRLVGGKQAQEIMSKMLTHVERYIESKLSSLNVRENGNISPNERKNENGKKYENRKEEKQWKWKTNAEKKVMKTCKNDREMENSSSDSTVSDDDSDRSYAPRRSPRSIADWRIKYDGKDDGKKLNKFIKEVEFMAEAENMSKRALFNEAIHLFAGDARTWYIEGKTSKDFRNWTELVTELKLEFQPPDMDFHYEQQAAQRRQKRSEKFQDYYNAVMEIFQYMAVQPSEQRKFDIMFRNLRSDYKNVLVVKSVRNLKSLKQWGRKLDSANMWMYRSRDSEIPPKTAQIHEVNHYLNQRDSKPSGKPWKTNTNAGKQKWQPKYETTKAIPPTKTHTWKDKAQQNSSRGDLEQKIARYQIPDKLVCFNCRGKFHHYEACLMEREVFCMVCGFYDFSTESCPYCAKNGRKSA